MYQLLESSRLAILLIVLLGIVLLATKLPDLSATLSERLNNAVNVSLLH